MSNLKEKKKRCLHDFLPITRSRNMSEIRLEGILMQGLESVKNNDLGHSIAIKKYEFSKISTGIFHFLKFKIDMQNEP